MTAVTPMTPETERIIRERVNALPHGGTYTDHVWLDSGLLIAKRTLLARLGCDVTLDPMPLNPFQRDNRKQFMQPNTGSDGAP